MRRGECKYFISLSAGGHWIPQFKGNEYPLIHPAGPLAQLSAFSCLLCFFFWNIPKTEKIILIKKKIKHNDKASIVKINKRIFKNKNIIFLLEIVAVIKLHLLVEILAKVECTGFNKTPRIRRFNLHFIGSSSVIENYTHITISTYDRT